MTMQYRPHPRPDDNPFYPWHVIDTLDNDSRMGPGFSAIEAAVVAWALSNQRSLINENEDLRLLVNQTVETSLPSFQGATRAPDGSQDPITRAYLKSMGLDPDGDV